MRDVFGVFISIDKIMQFRPSIVDVGGKRSYKYYTYIFATLNIFSADNRNLLFSHPVFLTDVFSKKTGVGKILTVTLRKLAAQLKDGKNPYTQTIRQRLQRYFGPPGVSREAIRRTAKPLHATDGYFENTFGVMEMCDDCVGVADQSGMARPNATRMGDFARFFLNARLARFRQVAFLPDQSRLVQQKTGDVASTAKEGDVKRDFSAFCLPEYDETGKSRICVKVPPPRNRVWIGVRSAVKAEAGSGSLVGLRFLTAVDIEAEIAGRKDPLMTDVSEGGYVVPSVRGEQVSDVYYVNALIRAINKFQGKQLR
jgi:hypothetical protein